MNATSFIRLVSLAIGQTLGGRNEIVVTDMDHEANVATWLALERNGARIRWWKMRDDGNLHVDDLIPLVHSSTRVVACTLASNAIGSIVDVAAAARVAHASGAEIFLDAVHYGPHGLIDVQAFDCDYLVCSGYKIFGPHMGFLWGRRELLEKPPDLPRGFHPRRAPRKDRGGHLYLRKRGRDGCRGKLPGDLGEAWRATKREKSDSRRNALQRAFEAIRVHEESLSIAMLRVLNDCGAVVYGVAQQERIGQRVPTLCFNLPNLSPAKVTEELAKQNIGARDGHMYSPRLMKRLGLAKESGAVRASLVHYNTVEEVRRFGRVLSEIRESC